MMGEVLESSELWLGIWSCLESVFSVKLDNSTCFAFQSEDTLWYKVPFLFVMASESNPDLCYSSGLLEKGPGVKRLSSLDDKIPPKSPCPRRTIWLSRSQSDIFSSKPPRTVSVLDPYYQPRGGAARTPKINPFSARQDLKGGKIKFFDLPSKSVISSLNRSSAGRPFESRGSCDPDTAPLWSLWEWRSLASSRSSPPAVSSEQLGEL